MPWPREGEDEQAYVERFMKSAEAQRDYPDEKQRLAVAYGMFKEKKPAAERGNDMELCPDCGAEMKGDADKVACTACGREIRKPTPVANLGDTCPSCFHSKAELHDSIGCKAENCGCTNALTNAGGFPENRCEVCHNYGDKLCDSPGCFSKLCDRCKKDLDGRCGIHLKERRNDLTTFQPGSKVQLKGNPNVRGIVLQQNASGLFSVRLEQTGLVMPYYGGDLELSNAGDKLKALCPSCGTKMADQIASILPQKPGSGIDKCDACGAPKTDEHFMAMLHNSDDDETLRRLNEDFKRKHNVDVGKTVSARGKSGKVIDFGGNEVRIQWEGGGADWVNVSELKNSGLDTAQERWEWSDRFNRFIDLTKAGIPDSLATKCVLLDWSALDLDVRDAYSAKFERRNGYEMAKCSTCGHVDGQHDGLHGKCFDEAQPNDTKAQAHPADGFKRCSCLKFERQLKNAASQAAFEAHTASCAGCANALETGKPEAMCAEGQKLIQAENAQLWKCPKCGSSDTVGETNPDKKGELLCKGCGHRFMDFEAKNADKYREERSRLEVEQRQLTDKLHQIEEQSGHYAVLRDKPEKQSAEYKQITARLSEIDKRLDQMHRDLNNPENKNISAGAEYAKKHGIKHPKDLPFDQPNEHGCNGCDAVKVPLNADGYCKECASQQGAFEFTNAAALCGGCGKQFEGGTETFQEGRPEGQLCPECKAKENKNANERLTCPIDGGTITIFSGNEGQCVKCGRFYTSTDWTKEIKALGNDDGNGPVAAVRGSMSTSEVKPYLSNDFKAAEGARLYGSGRV